MGEIQDMIHRAKTKSKPPKNEIIPEKLGQRLEQKFDGLILDTDTNSIRLSNMNSRIAKHMLWSLIRDFIVIILLGLILGLVVWRAVLVENRFDGCTRSGDVETSRLMK